jgi:uncharacterized protein (DUF58 family)
MCAEAMANSAGARLSRTTAEAATLAARLPSLVIAARRVADSVMHGVHGRRRAGPGETFWQFRPFISGEPASRVDWRRSAREAHAYVREREWEAAQTLWLWLDRSPSMRFASTLAPCEKFERAIVLALALADLAVRGGERVGLVGLTRPIATRGVIERFAEILGAAERDAALPLPPAAAISARAKIVLLSDFLSPAEEVAAALANLGGDGAEGYLIAVSDPVEETYPFAGHTEFVEMSGPRRLRAPRAESLREKYLSRLAAHREALSAVAARRGWSVMAHRTDQSPSAALLALVERLAGPRFQGVG